MEKVYLKGGPFAGEVRATVGDELIAQFPPGHARYVDRGETIRVFAYEPREKDENFVDAVKVDGRVVDESSGE